MKRSHQSITHLITRDFPVFHITDSIETVLTTFRSGALKHKIIYLYVVDDHRRLVGVVPVHRILTASPSTLVKDIYINRCISLPHTVSMSEARKAFATHKLLAFPVIDDSRQFIGTLNIEAFAGDLGDISAHPKVDDLYELFGISAELKKEKNILKRFSFRLPWLFATFTTGLFAALLTGHFQTTLQQYLSLFFFLTLVLGLNESVAMQATTLAVTSLHKQKPSLKNYFANLLQELPCALLLGLFYGGLTGILSSLFKSSEPYSWLLGLTLILTMTLSCFWGISVPFFFHRLNKDPKVASGPLVLGLSDLGTLSLFFYFAKLFLSRVA